MMANIRHVANSRKPEGVGGNEEAPVAGMPCTMMGRRPFFDLMRDREVVAGGCRAILLQSLMRHFCASAQMKSWGTGTRFARSDES
jgi:hypothetical protein